MSFKPSAYSYYGEATPPETGEGEGGVPSDEILSAVRTFFFGKGAREESAKIKAQIDNYQQLAAQGGPLKVFYLNEINKLQGRLATLEAQAAEERYDAQVTATAKTAVAIASVLGVLVVGGLALNQFQNLRIRQEELKRLRGG